MAVDTAQKRYSMIAFGGTDEILFEVDGAVDLDDRQHLLGAYSGIAFSSDVSTGIDTKEKRAAVLGVARPFMRDKFPVATPDEEWRINSGNAYGGNALSPAGGVTVPLLEGRMLTGGLLTMSGGL